MADNKFGLSDALINAVRQVAENNAPLPRDERERDLARQARSNPKSLDEAAAPKKKPSSIGSGGDPALDLPVRVITNLAKNIVRKVLKKEQFEVGDTSDVYFYEKLSGDQHVIAGAADPKHKITAELVNEKSTYPGMTHLGYVPVAMSAKFHKHMDMSKYPHVSEIHGPDHKDGFSAVYSSDPEAAEHARKFPGFQEVKKEEAELDEGNPLNKNLKNLDTMRRGANALGPKKIKDAIGPWSHRPEMVGKIYGEITKKAGRAAMRSEETELDEARLTQDQRREFDQRHAGTKTNRTPAEQKAYMEKMKKLRASKSKAAQAAKPPKPMKQKAYVHPEGESNGNENEKQEDNANLHIINQLRKKSVEGKHRITFRNGKTHLLSPAVVGKALTLHGNMHPSKKNDFQERLAASLESFQDAVKNPENEAPKPKGKFALGPLPKDFQQKLDQVAAEYNKKQAAKKKNK